MPEVEHSVTVRAPVQTVFEFVKDFDNWAPFLIGYQSHEVVNDTDSIWTIKGDVGILSRTVKLEIHITEWVEGERVSFRLHGLTESVEGSGSFVATPHPDGSTLSFQLSLKAGGMAGPMVNAVMGPLLRPAASSLATKISERVEEQLTTV